MAAKFIKGFNKVAGATGVIGKALKDHTTLEHVGLGVLGGSAAVHGYKAIKEKNKGDAAAAGLDIAGLGILSRATHLASKTLRRSGWLLTLSTYSTS